MKQAQFEKSRQPRWQAFEQLLKLKPSAQEKSLAQFPAEYRFICHSLSLAKSRGYSPQLIDYLNHLMLEGHRKLYRSSGFSWLVCVHFLTFEFPQLVRQHWRAVLTAHLIFYLPFVLTFAAIQWQPDLAYELIDADQLAGMETMYDPSSEKLGRERASDSDWLMFGHYIQNNISIAFQTFASGLMAGVGSIFYLFYNGLFFGVIASHLFTLGYTEPFFSFIIGHGSFELTAIVLSGAAGLRLGFALLSPGQLSRSSALKLAASQSIRLMLGVTAMLVIAAFVEAFWSSMTLISPQTKYIIGTLFWCLVYGYLLLVGKEDAAR